MKKNEKKWIVIAIILAVMVIVGNILNMNVSAKKEEVEEPIKAKAELVTVWLRDGEWGESLTKIVEAFKEDYEEVKITNSYWNSDRNRMEITFTTECGDVTGHIYER